MDLADLKFNPITTPPPLPKRPDPSPPIKDGELIFPDSAVSDSEEEEKPICSKCEIDGSFPLGNGVCSICGAVWEPLSDDDSDEFSTALELLESCQLMFELLLKRRKVLNKLGQHDEVKLRDLAMNVADFTETYEWRDVTE